MPYGDAIGVSALTNDETDELWKRIREDNADRTSPAGKGGPDVFVCVDDRPKVIRDPHGPKTRARRALSKRSMKVVEEINPKVVVNLLGKDGRALLN